MLGRACYSLGLPAGTGDDKPHRERQVFAILSLAENRLVKEPWSQAHMGQGDGGSDSLVPELGRAANRNV